MNSESARIQDASSVGINWRASDCLPRDAEQSRLLHEPNSLTNSVDPITGQDLAGLPDRPYVVDGKLTIYFESDSSRKVYLDLASDRSLRLADNPTGEGEAEG